MKKFFSACLLCSIGLTAMSQETINSVYDPHELFAPLTYPVSGTITRAATGEPNVGYWQNRADYNISATLDDANNEISGTVTIRMIGI